MGLLIDLNSDVGERPEALADGSEEEILRSITSANIACGGHAGDPTTIARVMVLCLKHAVSIGAHPGFPDRAGFGRIEMLLSPQEIAREVAQQVELAVRVAREHGTMVHHVKPHGALYTMASRDEVTAGAIAEGVRWVDRGLVLLGLAGSMMLEVWQGEGFRVVGEAFADRRYEADGSLRSRKHPDALISDPDEAAAQAVRLIEHREVLAVDGTRIPVEAQTICVHGDTPNAAMILETITSRLREAGIQIRPFV